MEQVGNSLLLVHVAFCFLPSQTIYSVFAISCAQFNLID